MRTVKNLKEFIEQMKNMSPEIPADSVKSLINSGKSSPYVARRSFQPRRIKQMFNPLKILIMITPIVIITAALLIFSPGNKDRVEKNFKITDQQIIREVITGKTETPKTNNQAEKRVGSQILFKEIGPFKDVHEEIAYPIEKDSTYPIADLNLSSLKTIKLSPEIFKSMGFQISGDTIFYPIRVRHALCYLTACKEGYTVGLQGNLRHFAPDPAILFFVGHIGKKGENNYRANAYGNFDNYQMELELCIPVQIDDPKMPELVRNTVFWMFPTDVFFKSLPIEIAGPMEKEFTFQKERLNIHFTNRVGGGIEFDTINRVDNSIGKAETAKRDNNTLISGSLRPLDSTAISTKPVPCVYFTNLCESLPGLDYVNLYPNPATDKLNVDLIMQKAKRIQFRVFDMGGRMISDEGSRENYPEGGQVKHQLDITGLKSGLYLLVMTDDEGAKLTRRFVKN